MTQAFAAISPNCFGVLSPMVPFYFWDAWELLKPAVARNGLYTEESLRIGLATGEMQLWCAEENGEMTMALVTEISVFPARKQCTLMFIGGGALDQCLPFLETIEAWARENGCERIVVDGRRGWLRKLKNYFERNVVLVKDLTDG